MVDLNSGVVRPRFRQDLVAEPIEDNGAKFIDVADPDSGHVFRFYEVEYSLACAMDGERDVAGIIRWAQEELGLSTTPNEVKTVIATLGDLGYLEGAGVPVAASRPSESAREPAPSPAKPAPAKPQPAAASDLAPGVVVGKAKPAQPAPADLELGQAGSRPAPAAELPRAPELELGAPGAAPAPAARTAAPAPADVALGTAGRAREPEPPPRSEVSIDLSEHLAVRPDDVKEAVRASQIMRAVEVPKELLDEQAAESAPAPAPEPAKPGPRAPAPDQRPAPVAARPAPETRPEPEKRPEPVKRAEPEKRPQPAAPAPAQRAVHPALLFLAIVVVLAAGAFAVYKYVIKKSEQTEKTSAVAPAPVVPAKPAPTPPAPPPETEKLALDAPAPQELKAPTAGQIETIVANKTSVKAGDVVAKLAGAKPVETEVTSLQRDIDKRVAPELAQAEKDRDAAQAAGNKAGVTAAEARIADRKKSLEDKQAKLATKQAELDKYLVKAPVDGTVSDVVKANAHVTPADVVARVTPPATLVATFKSAGDAPKDAHVLLGVQGKDTKLACKVVQIDDTGTKIACPQDAAAVGDVVTFAGIDLSAPAGSEPAEIDMGDEPAGSGSAGSAAPAPAPAHGAAPAHRAAPAHGAAHAAHADEPAAPAHGDTAGSAGSAAGSAAQP